MEVRFTHVPATWQQAPTSAAQGFGEQVVPLPMYVSPDVPPQAAAPLPEAFLTAHVPSAAQQAPVGMVQGLGEQALPTTPKVLGSAHAEGRVSVHTPRVEQHGPTLAVHRPGEQVEPTPRKMFAPVQDAGVTPALQTPEVVQHAPVIVAHGPPAQVVPTPRKVVVQAFAETTVQTLGVAFEQHAPWQALGVQAVPTP